MWRSRRIGRRATRGPEGRGRRRRTARGLGQLDARRRRVREGHGRRAVEGVGGDGSRGRAWASAELEHAVERRSPGRESPGGPAASASGGETSGTSGSWADGGRVTWPGSIPGMSGRGGDAGEVRCRGTGGGTGAGASGTASTGIAGHVAGQGAGANTGRDRCRRQRRLEDGRRRRYRRQLAGGGVRTGGRSGAGPTVPPADRGLERARPGRVRPGRGAPRLRPLADPTGQNSDNRPHSPEIIPRNRTATLVRSGRNPGLGTDAGQGRLASPGVVGLAVGAARDGVDDDDVASVA